MRQYTPIIATVIDEGRLFLFKFFLRQSHIAQAELELLLLAPKCWDLGIHLEAGGSLLRNEDPANKRGGSQIQQAFAVLG